jgi:uncharacterized protein (TIGR03000 family)
MNRLISFAGGAAVAVAVLLASGPAANAQGKGGRTGGAYYGHNGGGNFNHGGGNWGHYGGNYGHYYGNYGHGYGYGYGYGYPAFGLYLGLGGLGYGGYGGYGGDYGYASSYYGGAAPVYGDAGAQTQAAYPPPGGSARIVIYAPADAQVWVDSYQVNQSGPVRVVDAPAGLEPNKTYHYTIKAQWNANGQPVTQEKTVDFQAGQLATVNINQSQATGTAPERAPAPTAAPAAPPVPSTPPATPPATTPPANPVRPG